ncbi:hypothetical protein [Arenimonas composti]|uniref:Uncharacterized protein n=1 Tax=Arenimonas composti TR7-09 = DSM 18010 TaxID=1121013 RepID=A0A091BKU6_9GAMM|nr:hypothetical protein [Arenimonas composti]KFN51414.1 hypothetical protein P873_02805 [Arenimonas composti TR7-09 = DSM 18010]
MTERRPPPAATPSLGALDDLDLDGGRDPPAAPPSSPPPPRRLGPWLALAVAILALAGLALGLAHWRESLSRTLVPPSDLHQLLAEAQSALARGELSNPDGSGARERFNAVLARDPDHAGARSGLVAVRDAALLQARTALAAGDATTARARVELARSLAAPAADLEAIDHDLQQLESAEADLAGLLTRAEAARAAGRLEELPDGALALYAEALARWPENALALQGRRQALTELLRRAEVALDHDDLATAQALVARVVADDPSHLDLPAVRARLGEAQSRQAGRREAALAAAAAALRRGQPETAGAAYRELLAADPESLEARAGLDDAAAALAARAGRQAADFDFTAAEASLELARDWSPDLPAIAVAERALSAARARAETLPAPSDPDDFARLLRQAGEAMRRGDLIDPPGDSAWDRLRAAAAIAPDDPSLAAATGEYDRRARACFEDALASNRLSRAQACLDAMAARVPGEGLADERRRLGNRWLAFAEERLGAGELALARRALVSAEQVDPGNPGLASMRERLRKAL